MRSGFSESDPNLNLPTPTQMGSVTSHKIWVFAIVHGLHLMRKSTNSSTQNLFILWSLLSKSRTPIKTLTKYNEEIIQRRTTLIYYFILQLLLLFSVKSYRLKQALGLCV